MIRIHFLNVGDGDCTLIEFPSDHLTMVDINNSKSLDEETEKELRSQLNISPQDYMSSKLSGRNPFTDKAYNIELSDPVDYLKSLPVNKSLFRFICTHPDMDHLSGLYRLYKEEKIPIINLWDSEHNFEKSEQDFENQNKYDKRDWDTYQELRDASLSEPKTLFLERHANGQYYTDDGIYLLASTKQLKKLAYDKGEPNHLSYVLMLVHGNCKIILGGDATPEVWEDILNEFGTDNLKADILKASHHGRESGYHQEAVKAISPRLTIVSVGKKPDTDASNQYRQYSSNVWSTRWKGNIILECYEDGRINYTCQYDR